MDDMRNGVGLTNYVYGTGSPANHRPHRFGTIPKRPRPVANVPISALVMRRAADLRKRDRAIMSHLARPEWCALGMACMLVMHERGMSIAAISAASPGIILTICYGSGGGVRYERSERRISRGWSSRVRAVMKARSRPTLRTDFRARAGHARCLGGTPRPALDGASGAASS